MANRPFGRWLFGATAVIASVAGCSLQNGDDRGDPVFFWESDYGYEAVSILGESTQVEADRLALFGVMDLVRTNAGYLVVDSGNDRLLLFDWKTGLARIVGREGSGPGEFQFPTRIARWGDTLVVLDANLRRVSRFSLDGGFVSTIPVWGNSEDVALHPSLGILVVTDADRHHYLARLNELEPDKAPLAFAPIPTGLGMEAAAYFQARTDRVAVTPDGTIHVLDGRHLALVSYGIDGSVISVLYLPEEERARRMEENRLEDEALGGPRVVVASPIIDRLEALPDGRLFATVPRLATDPEHRIGYVLDLENREAISVRLPPRLSEWGSSLFLDGDRLVVARTRTGMALFELALLDQE